MLSTPEDLLNSNLVTTTFHQGVDGYIGTVDTFLSGDRPDKTFHKWRRNEIDLSMSGNHEHTLLRFDDMFGSGDGQIPFGSEIVSATLTFYVVNGGNRITLHRMLTNWDETATWNSFNSGIQTDNNEALTTADAQSKRYVSRG
ncbi:MAG: hypothetical protein CMJ78_20925 [Planctomycetaceae bacterium]|nr:hypothetical protein [Planctomycetaceae bacterium]